MTKRDETICVFSNGTGPKSLRLGLLKQDIINAANNWIYAGLIPFGFSTKR